MRVDDSCDRLGCEKGRIPVDHEHLFACELVFGDLLQRVRSALRLTLKGGGDAPFVEVGGNLRVMRVGDDLDVLGAGPRDRVQNVVEHGAATDRVEDFGNTRAHPGAVTRGEYDGS